MAEPKSDAYERARGAYDSVVIQRGGYGHRAGHHDAVNAAVDAVWPLAVAEGRRQAAADIRAEIITAAPIPNWAQSGGRPTASGLREWAATMAAGNDSPPCRDCLDDTTSTTTTPSTDPDHPADQAWEVAWVEPCGHWWYRRVEHG